MRKAGSCAVVLLACLGSHVSLGACALALPRLKVVAESARWVVVDKPSGVSCHRSSKGDGVLSLLRMDALEAGATEADCSEYRLVHRLDDGTSGCLVVAKDRDTAAALCDAFRSRRARKAYVALVSRAPKKKKCTMRGDVVKGRRGAWKLERSCTRGRCACTVFTKAIGLGPSSEADVAVKCLVARPVTGKTHQIRVAAKANGAPILGDDLYAGHSADRLYLHAAALRIPDLGIDCATPPTSGHSFLTDRFAEAWATLDWSVELGDGALPKSATDHPALRPQ